MNSVYEFVPLSGASFDLLVEFTDIIMMRKCMLSIKRRANRPLSGPVRQEAASLDRTSQFLEASKRII